MGPDQGECYPTEEAAYSTSLVRVQRARESRVPSETCNVDFHGRFPCNVDCPPPAAPRELTNSQEGV